MAFVKNIRYQTLASGSGVSLVYDKKLEAIVCFTEETDMDGRVFWDRQFALCDSFQKDLLMKLFSGG